MLRECAKAFSGFQIKTVHGMAKKVPSRNQVIIRNSLACNMVRMLTKIFPGTFHPKQVKSRSGSLKLQERWQIAAYLTNQMQRPRDQKSEILQSDTPRGNGLSRIISMKPSKYLRP